MFSADYDYAKNYNSFLSQAKKNMDTQESQLKYLGIKAQNELWEGGGAEHP